MRDPCECCHIGLSVGSENESASGNRGLSIPECCSLVYVESAKVEEQYVVNAQAVMSS